MKRLKIIPIIALLTLKSSSNTDLNNNTILKQINIGVLAKQLLSKDSKHPNENIISEGLKYNKITKNNTTYHIITLEEQYQNKYNIKIEIATTPKRLEYLICDEALAGINGSFFTKEKTIGLVRFEGQNINKHVRIRGDGYFTIENNTPKIKEKINDITTYETILQSFPMLIYNGEIRKVENEKKSYRSAIATDEHNNLHLITTNTNPLRRNKVTLEEFAHFLKTQNYTNALNLDGGKSAQMIYQIQIDTQNKNHTKNQERTYNYVRNHRGINNAITISRRNK